MQTGQTERREEDSTNAPETRCGSSGTSAPLSTHSRSHEADSTHCPPMTPRRYFIVREGRKPPLGALALLRRACAAAAAAVAAVDDVDEDEVEEEEDPVLGWEASVGCTEPTT